MSFDNGKFSQFEYRKARWIGNPITPTVVVLHDTASRITEGSAARYLQDNERKVSVHFVVERDGSIEQQVPVGLRANHAGHSVYHGRPGVNNFSVGIEVVNPGRMTRHSDGNAVAWFKKKFSMAEHDIQEVTTPEHGHGLWMDYTEAQIDSLINLLGQLFGHVDTLRDIVTHWYISPGRKVDTNPLFPLEHIRSLVLGREDPRDAIEAEAVEAEPDEMVQIDVPDDALNLRRWPSFNPNVITAIPDGAVVPVLKYGTFEGRGWAKVLYGGQEGWVVSRYTAAILHNDKGTEGR